MRSRSILRISLVAAALATSRAFVVPTARVLTPSFRRGVCSAMATSSPPHAVSEIRPPAVVGAPVESIETPALTLDLDIFEKNCDRMSDLLLRTPGVALRPHVKAHKCPELAALQMQIARDRGVICQGVCAQQMREVEVMVRGGIADVLLTNQAVGPGKIARLVEAAAEAASKGGRVAVLVDSEANAADISAAAAERGVVVPAYVEVEAGQGRSGVAASGPALLAVARAVAAAPGLELAGVHCYNGLLQHVRDPADRARRVAEEVVAGSAAAAVAALEAAGLWAPGMVVTGAGTGSFLAEASSGVFTEVQPGSYVFMDADYAKNAWPADVAADVAADAGAGAPPFAQALHLLGTVVSRRGAAGAAGATAVLDVGSKAADLGSGPPTFAGRATGAGVAQALGGGPTYTNAGDEHGTLDLSGGIELTVGDTVWLVPGHCDPTVAKHLWLVGHRAGRVERLFAVHPGF